MNSLPVSLPLIAMGAAVASICLHLWRTGRDLRGNGIEAQARIMKKFRRPGLENCYVLAHFYDLQGVIREADI